MKLRLALLLAFIGALSGPAIAATLQLATCNGTVSAAGACPTANQVCANPTQPTSMTKYAVGNVQTYVQWQTIPAAGGVLECSPIAAWIKKSNSGVVIAPAPPPTPPPPNPTPTPSPPPAPTPAPNPESGVAAVTLNWPAPTTNTDGSALTNLASFNVYQGASPTTLAKVINVPASVLTYTTPTLAPGTYYFGVTAVNTAGKESADSQLTEFVINLISTPATPSAPASLTLGITVTGPIANP